MVEVKTVDTDKAAAAVGPYSQAKIVGDLVYTSGQIPINPASGKIESEDVQDQTHAVVANLNAILEEAGSGLDQVVKATCFLTDMGDFQAFNEVYAEYFTSKPARSCYQVCDLPAGAKCEIEVIAVVK